MQFLDKAGVRNLKKYIDEQAGEVIIGTQTTTTGNWVGVSRLATASDLKSGYRFTYWLPYNGSGNATLTLTFQDNTTKTIDLYYSGSSRLTTHIGAGNKIDFVYLENANVAGTLYTGAWIDKGYYTTDTYTQLSYYESKYIYSANAPLYRYKLCGYRDGRIVPLVTTNQTSTTIVSKAPTTIGIDPGKGIVYYNTTANITNTSTPLGAQTINNERAISLATYTFNTDVPTYCDIYLKGTYVDGLFTLDTTSNTSWYVYAPSNSTSEAYNAVFTEGSYYIFVGPSYSTVNYFELKIENPLYIFEGGKLIPVAYKDYNTIINNNAYVTSAALNDLNDRLETVESSLEDYVTAEDYSVIEEVVRDNYTKQEADVKFATLDDINGLMSAIANALNASCAITESPGGNRTYTFTLNQG